MQEVKSAYLGPHEQLGPGENIDPGVIRRPVGKTEWIKHNKEGLNERLTRATNRDTEAITQV